LYIESSKNELRDLIQDRFKSDDVVKTLEQDRIRLQTELDLVKRDLEERNRELQKERTRIENMIRQEQVIHSRISLSSYSFALECSIKTKITFDSI
jgi:hypothetical protein